MSKKETLEEAALKAYPIYMEFGEATVEHDSNEELREAFIEGAKWGASNNNIDSPLELFISEMTEGMDNPQASVAKQRGIILGVKWQSERSYTGDEVLSILQDFANEIQEVEDIKEWFKFYKK